MINKKDILDYCVQSVHKRIAEIDLAIRDANNALADDTKSSAGDKYETSREMVQQDLNRYEGQLKIAHHDLEVLQKIDPLADKSVVGLGAIVVTNKGYYFIATSIGLLKDAGLNIFIISPVSPIGQILLGRKKGDTITFNNINQEILDVY